jgi:DNA polymerase-4
MPITIHPATTLHIDMNAFFASVEQLANPFIRNKPVGVGGVGYDNAALLAISYEAKRAGVPKFARLKEARRICPNLVAVPFDPLKYYAVNRQIIDVFQQFTPLVEVYSIDEAFLNIEPTLHLYNNDPMAMGAAIKQRILDEVGITITSSVGIAPNKLLAKVASNWVKPNGLTLIEWDQRFEYLDQLPLDKIWGIGGRSAEKLNAFGIKSTKGIRNMPDATLRQLVGSYYTRLKLIANGEYYDQVSPGKASRPHKTMQHAHTLSTPLSDSIALKSYIRKQSERLAKRLRRHQQLASVVYLGLKPEKQKHYGWGSNTRYSDIIHLELPSDDGAHIYKAACQILDGFMPLSERIRLLAVGVAELSQSNQLIFDMLRDKRAEALNQARDEIDAQFGQFTLRTGDIVYNYAKESRLSIDKQDMVFHPE